MNLQNLLGIELPIIQAPMAGWQGSDLAIAVCNAGGSGSPCTPLSLDVLHSYFEAGGHRGIFLSEDPTTQIGALAALRKKAASLGSGDFSPLWAGQNVSGCREISAAPLTRMFVS